MKKLYKLLFVILLTFFIGIINVNAYQLKEASLGNNRTSIGEESIIYFYYDDTEFQYKGQFTAKAHFTTTGGPEVVVDVDVKNSKYLITEDFLPEHMYQLAYLELFDKDGTVTRYSPFESGEYIKIDSYNSSVYVKEMGPIKSVSVYSDGYKPKGYNGFYKHNEKVRFKMDLNFAINSGKFTLRNENDKDNHVFELKPIGNDIYEIDLSKDSTLKVYSYYVSEIELVANGKTYGYGNYSTLDYQLPYSGSIAVYKDILNSYTIEKETAALNEKVYINLLLNDKAIAGEMKFKGEKGQFTVSIRDIDTKPYIVIPYTAKLGDYDIDYISISSNNGNKLFDSTVKYVYSSKDEYIKENNYSTIHEKRDYHNKLTVVKDETTIIGELLELDNDLITDDIIKEIKNIKDGIEINIDASNNSVVKSDIFEAIKGHDKTLNIKYKDFIWTFNGKDITEVKKLNVNFVVASFKKYEDVTKAVKNGALVVFANYGSLPGKAKIKFNINEELAKEVNGSKLNLYLYDSVDTGKFELIDTGIKQNKEGFYEIELSNTSSYYVVTPDEIADRFLIGYNFPLLLVIIIALSVITVVGIIVLVIIKFKKGKKKKEVKPVEEKKEEIPQVETTEKVETPVEETLIVEEEKKDEEII